MVVCNDGWLKLIHFSFFFKERMHTSFTNTKSEQGTDGFSTKLFPSRLPGPISIGCHRTATQKSDKVSNLEAPALGMPYFRVLP